MKADTAAEPKPDDLPETARRPAAAMPVVVLLGLLITATMLPPLAFSVFLLDRTNRAQQDVIAQLSEATAGAAVETIDRQLEGMVTTLRGFSTSNSLSQGNLPEIYQAARTALAGTDTFLIVADKDLNQLLNTRSPYGERLGKVSDTGQARLSLDSGATIISDGFLGRIAQNLGFQRQHAVEAAWPGPAFADPYPER